MTKLSLSKPTAGYNLAAINDNFTKLEAEFQNKVLYRDNPVGEPNTMEVALDMNSNDLLNVGDLTVLGNLSANGLNMAGLNSALVWRGAWSGAINYNVSDGVSLNGTSYICTVAHIGAQPPNASFWDVLALKGMDGTNGTGSGDVTGPSSSADDEVVVFSGTTGKIVKRSNQQISQLGGATGTGGDRVFYENDTVVNNSHVINRNSHTVGPLTVATGKTLTVATGKRLVVM